MKSPQVERNLNRLSLISAVNRVSETSISWARTAQVDTLGIQHVECSAVHGQVIPHGTDNDLLFGLINAYLNRGTPDDRMLRLSVAELLTLAGLEPCGSNYRAAYEGLKRLHSTSFTIYDSWWDNDKHQFTEASFHILDRFRRTDQYEEQAKIGQFQASNMLELQLASEITDSIRLGYLRALDIDVYRRLKQPLARALYRTLEEVRAPLIGKPMPHYSVNVNDWGKYLGFHHEVTKLIRRALESAHTNLLETGYLKAVEYQGRGREQMLLYTFGEVAPTASAISVALLTTRGIAHERAVQYAITISENALRQATQKLDGIVARSRKKVQNPAGLLVDILDHPEKYPEPLTTPPIEQKQPPKQSLATLPEIEMDRQTPQSPAERRTAFAKTVALLKLDGNILKQVAQNIENGRFDTKLVSDVQSRLVKLHMAGASEDERNAVLRELL